MSDEIISETSMHHLICAMCDNEKCVRGTKECYLNAAKREIKYDKQRIEEDVKAYDLAAKALDKTTEWIPVKERLPEKSGYFLVSVFVNKYEVVVIEEAWFAHKNEYDDIKESEWREIGGNGTVIAWMPLPEPYKAEKEEEE